MTRVYSRAVTRSRWFLPAFCLLLGGAPAPIQGKPFTSRKPAANLADIPSAHIDC